MSISSNINLSMENPVCLELKPKTQERERERDKEAQVILYIIQKWQHYEGYKS